MHRVREINIFASHSQNDIIGCECEDAGNSREEHSKYDTALLVSPRDSDSTATNHRVPGVEHDHDRAQFILTVVGLDLFGCQ